MTQLSPHFSLAELTRSNTAARLGLNNSKPPAAMLERLKRTAHFMERVREICGDKSIIVFSGYRSPAVNKAVGGSKTSSHMDGDACDFKVTGLTIQQTILKLRNSGLEFDQIIDEFNSWTHIGFGPRNRKQVLSARKVNGKTVYKGI